MPYLDFLSSIHSSTDRDYLSRVNDPEYPKPRAAELAKKWGYDYWDGDRRICYGGYKYIPERWKPVAESFIRHYDLVDGSCVLDVGCGKGFLLYEMIQLNSKINIRGLDISDYAISNGKPEIRGEIDLGCASRLPYADKQFDLAFSINTFHNLGNRKLENALREFTRVSKKQYLCVESYRNETERANLMYWQVTCEQINSPDDWQWWFERTNYTGDYSFIYFK